MKKVILKKVNQEEKQMLRKACFVTLVIALGSVVGCNAVPKLPGDPGDLSNEPQAQRIIQPSPVPGDVIILPPPPAPLPKPTVPPVIQESPFGVLLQTQVMDFMVGNQTDFQMDVWVPSPGLPLVNLKNLPDGAFFSLVDKKFIWAPGLGASDDIADPSSGLKLYPVGLELSSSTDPTTFLKRDFLLICRDPKGGLFIQANGLTWDVNEGTATSKPITLFETASGTTGLTLTVINAPIDVSIKQGANDRTYTIEYAGGNSVASNANPKECSGHLCTQSYPIILSAKSSSGAEAKLSIVVRLNTKI